MNLDNYTDESRGIVNGTVAGRSAQTPLNVWRYVWRNRSVRIILIVTLVFLFFGLGWIFEKGYYVTGGITTALGVLLLFLLWKVLGAQRQVFRHGLLVPGIVVGVNPTRVLAGANMSTGLGPTRFAIKVVTGGHLPAEYTAVGSELPCVASFRDGDSMEYWADFYPQPLCAGCGDGTLLENRKARIDSSEFLELKNLALAGKSPAEVNKVVFLSPPSVPMPPAPPRSN